MSTSTTPIDLAASLKGLAAAVEACPDEIETMHRALLASRGNRSAGLLELIARSAGDEDINAAVSNLRSQANALAKEGGDDDDDEIDWGEVAFIAIMILTL